MSLQATRSVTNESTPVIDRVKALLESGIQLDDPIATLFDTTSANLKQLVLTKVAETFIDGKRGERAMLDACEYYSIFDTIKFRTIVVADALRRNSLPRNAAEFLDLDAMQDYYGIGRSLLTLYRKRQRDQEPLFPEFHKAVFV